MDQIKNQKIGIRIILIVISSILFSININIFVRSACLFPGGFSGVSLLIQKVVEMKTGIVFPYSILTYIFNIVPVIIGFKYIGKKFTLLSCLLIFLSGLFTDLFHDFFPNIFVTDDMVLCTIFGGILNAFAVSLCLFAGSSSGGTDFIAIFIAEKTGKSAWGYIFNFNITVLFVAGLLLGWKAALYSIIFQYTSTQAMNIFYKKYEKTTLLIVTEKSKEIYNVIKELTNHTATVFEGKGEFSGTKRELIYSVVSASETGQLEKEIRKADPNAFINVIKSKEIVGKFFKRNPD